MRLHNRQIKATFWNDPDLLQWPRDKRQFYLGLIQLADDSGCLEDSPFAFKINLYPSPVDADITVDLIGQWVVEMVEDGKIIRYCADGKKCLYLRNFHKHQTLDNASRPDVPLPPWVTWIPYDKNPRAGKYIAEEETLTDALRFPDGSLTQPLHIPSNRNLIEPEKKRIEPEENTTSDMSSPKAPTTPDKKPAVLFPEGCVEHQLVATFRGLILANNPTSTVRKMRPYQIQAWCADFDKLIRLDGRDPPEIERVMRWAQSDEFWKANILSPSKLREKWDTLWLQMQRPPKEAKSNGTASRRGPSIEPAPAGGYTYEEFCKRHPGKPTVPEVQGCGMAGDAVRRSGGVPATGPPGLPQDGSV